MELIARHSWWLHGITRGARRRARLPRQCGTYGGTSFLRPGTVGPAELLVDVLRDGRSFTTSEVRLLQGGRLVCITRVTALRAGGGPEWSPMATDRPAPLESCRQFAPPPGIRHFEQADLRIDPSTIPDGTADYARVAGHVRPLDGRSIDASWLVMIGDCPHRRRSSTGATSRRCERRLHGAHPSLAVRRARTGDDAWLRACS